MSSVFDSEGVNPNNNYTFSLIKKVEDNYKSADTAIINTISSLSNDKITINVKDYGVVGNGTTDDTTNIQTAFNAIPANGGIIYFPRGSYKITNTIIIENKTNLLFKSDCAILQCYTNNGTYLYFNNCQHTEIEGALTINCNTSGLATSYGCLINNCQLSNFKNIFINGDFNIGLYANNNGTNYAYGCSINIRVQACRIGIHLRGEYYTALNCDVSGCTTHGIQILGGNNKIVGGNYNANLIGCQVYGRVIGNSDHGSITGATFNHNEGCGIWLKSIQYSYAVVGCQVWASIGPSVIGNGVNAVNARNSSFGIYAEDVLNLVISGNHIARNKNNLGLDGYCLCNITGNNFLSDTSRTSVQIAEYGIGNTAFATNAQNIICNNIFDGNTISGFKKFYFHDTLVPSVNVIKNNIGTCDTHILNMATVGTYEIGQHDHYFINFNISAPSSSSSPASQSSSITILSHMGGLSFKIDLYNNNNGAIWIKFKTSFAGSPIIQPTTNGDITYYSAYKAIKCTSTFNVMSINFSPLSNSCGDWLITYY